MHAMQAYVGADMPCAYMLACIRSYAEHPYSLFVRFDDGVKSELASLCDVKSIDVGAKSELAFLFDV